MLCQSAYWHRWATFSLCSEPKLTISNHLSQNSLSGLIETGVLSYLISGQISSKRFKGNLAGPGNPVSFRDKCTYLFLVLLGLISSSQPASMQMVHLLYMFISTSPLSVLHAADFRRVHLIFSACVLTAPSFPDVQF